MIQNYPNPEQIWFIRDLLHRLDENTLSEDEANVAKEIKWLLQKMESKGLDIINLVNVHLEDEIKEKLNNELGPFNRPGPIFMGSGYFAEYGCNKLHDGLHDSLSILSGLQQGGLMGSEPDSSDVIESGRREIRAYIQNLAEKLGEKIYFEEISTNID